MPTTLIPETGAALADANTYASLDYASTYHTVRGNDDWSGSDDELATALLMAFESMEALYGPKYLGSIQPTSTQRALFPRLPFPDNNGRLVNRNIPDCLLQAQCEIALLYLQGTNIFPVRSTDQNVEMESIKTGELMTTTKYSKAIEGETFPGFRKVDLLLAPLLRNRKSVSYCLGL